MPKQGTFGGSGFEKYGRMTRRKRFLNEMDKAVPWQALLEVIEPYYPMEPGHRGGRKKTRVRAKVEHPFHTRKRVFGFSYMRLRGIAKNTNRLHVTCAMANLHRWRHRLATWDGEGAPAGCWQAEWAAKSPLKTLPEGKRSGKSAGINRPHARAPRCVDYP